MCAIFATLWRIDKIIIITAIWECSDDDHRKNKWFLKKTRILCESSNSESYATTTEEVIGVDNVPVSVVQQSLHVQQCKHIKKTMSLVMIICL